MLSGSRPSSRWGWQWGEVGRERLWQEGGMQQSIPTLNSIITSVAPICPPTRACAGEPGCHWQWSAPDARETRQQSSLPSPPPHPQPRRHGASPAVPPSPGGLQEPSRPVPSQGGAVFGTRAKWPLAAVAGKRARKHTAIITWFWPPVQGNNTAI